jgi:hypothetical protein
MQEILKQRMEQLGYSQYRLTKEVCQIRAQDGEVPPVTKYQSSVRQAIDHPEQVKWYIVEDLIKAMDGEIVIRWNNRQDVKAS